MNVPMSANARPFKQTLSKHWFNLEFVLAENTWFIWIQILSFFVFKKDLLYLAYLLSDTAFLLIWNYVFTSKSSSSFITGQP